MKPKQKKRPATSAVQLVDEAVHLLRCAPGALLPSYYIGSLPFVLGLLYFWADMSCSPTANVTCAAASFGLALLFGWMKLWQAEFARQIQLRIHDSGETMPFSRRLLSGLETQSLLQPTGLLMLPVAAVMVLPLGRCFAFYQHLTAGSLEEPRGFQTSLQQAWDLAALWPRQNYAVLSLLTVFGIVVAVNLGIGIYLLPHLVKLLFGVNSMFTMSGTTAVNTTFWATVAGLTYLVMDPVVKTVYVLRGFYGRSLRSARDLKTELDACRRLRQEISST